MKSLKKALCTFLAVIMVLTAVPLGQFAGVDFSNLFATEASAAGLNLDDDDYVATHEYFVDSDRYYNMMENGRLYNNVDMELLGDAINAGFLWGFVGDIGKALTLQFSNSSLLKMASTNPYDLILADLLTSYTYGKAFDSVSTSAAYDFYKNSYESLMHMLRSTSEWKAEYEDSVAIEVKGWLRDPNYDFSDTHAYEILKSCFSKLDANLLIGIFDGLDYASKISEVLSTAGNLFDGYIEAYHAYTAALAYIDASESFISTIRIATSKMEVIPAALLNSALSHYEENINSDEDAFDYALEQFKKSTAMTFAGVVESLFSKSNTKFVAKVIGVAPAELGILSFAYNMTYNVLDFILKHSNTTNLAVLTYATALFESGLGDFVSEECSHALRSIPNIANAQLFDCAWGMLQCIEQYGYKTAAEFSLSKNLGTRIIKFFNKTHTNNDMEVAASWQSAWRNAGCHDVVIMASKDVLVQCPVDIEVYDNEDNLLFVINDDTVDVDYKDTFVEIYGGDKKFFSVPCDVDCKIVIRSREDGEMSYKVFENNNFSISRVVEYNDIKLEKGKIFEADVPSQINISADSYNLETENEIVEYTYDSLPPIEDNIIDVIVAEELFDRFPVEIIDLVADTMFNMKSVVDLSAYDISTDDAVALFSAIAKYYPTEYSLIANSDFTYKIIVSPSLDRIMNIRFYYGDDANLSTYQKRVKDLNAEIDALVAKVEGMNDFEKALYIHDYIVLNCEYDLELLDILETNGTLTGELRSERYTEYSVLVNGTGICGSYALAYRAILNAAGMECLYLSSSQMNHAWNLVKIDGNWYHVDCCWDDPTPDTYGRARRTYFLRTDSEIMSLNHYAWSPGQYKATSEKYSDMPRGYDIHQKYYDGKWYYVNGTTLYSSDEYGKNETEITSMSASSIDVDDNSVYFSSGRYIYEYDMETSEKNLVYMLSNKDSGEKQSDAYLSNIYVDDENVEYYKSIYKNDKRITVFDTDTLQREKFDAITGIEISQTEATLDVFETMQLTADITTTGSADNLEIEWSSSDDSLLQVDNRGKITAANVGTATVTARIFDFSSSCTLTVTGNGLSGMCGTNAKWLFDSNSHELVLSGTGKLPDYDLSDNVPWSKYINIVESITVNDGITYLGDFTFGSRYSTYDKLKSVNLADTIKETGSCVFENCENLEEIKLPSKLTKINADVFKGCKSLKNIKLPNTVTEIWSGAFGSCAALESIEFSDNLVSIGSQVFSNCSKLKNVVLPNTVKEIGIELDTFPVSAGYSLGAVFYNCYSLESVVLPKSIKTISQSMFNGDSALKNIIIPDTVTTIEDSAFAGCSSLTNVSIPNNVTIIADSAFANCGNLEQINVDSANKSYVSISGILYNKEKTKIIIYPSAKMDKSFSIPNSVTSIGDYAFYKNNLNEIVLSDNITEIGSLSFANSYNLKSIVIPEKVSKIGKKAFNNCYLLESITVNDNNSFYCSVDGVLFDKDMISIIYYPPNKKDVVYSIPSGVQKCSPALFGGANNLRSLIVPESFTSSLFDNDISSILAGDNINYSIEYLYIKSPNCNLSLDYLLNWYSLTKVYTLKNSGNSWYFPLITQCTFYSTTDTVAYKNFMNSVDVNAEPHVHDYFLFGYEEPTETKDGYELWTCYKEDDSYITPVHYFGEEITIEPTCTIDGAKAKSCLNCGEVIVTETTPATGEHNYQYVSTTPGDCITAPVMNYKCTDCNSTMTKTGKIDDGHKHVEVVVAPTCTEKGYTTATCEVCLETVIYDFKSPIGHDLTIKKSDSYCSAHDAIEYSCKKCDYSETVAADKENLVTETVIVDPTCTKSGTKSEICTLCGATVSTEIISPLSHEYAEDFTIDLDATCSTAGRKSQHCIRCDAKRAVTTIDPLGHSEDILPAVAATCTATGLTEGKKCSVCGEVTVEQAVTEKLTHKEVTVNQKDATATEDGYTGDVVCELCGEVFTVGTIIPATGEENHKCDHLCHKSGFMGFIWKIARFFYKLFKINPVCECGAAHY